MLIDDNPDDNFFHERILKKADCTKTIIIKQSCEEALEHLQSKEKSPELRPDLIFLDINMPGMNGWEFIEEYKKLPKELQSQTIVVMLTTSSNPDDRRKAKFADVIAHFESKPLTSDIIQNVLQNFFPDYY